MADRLPKIRSQLDRNERSILRNVAQFQTYKGETDAQIADADRTVSAGAVAEALDEMQPCCDRYATLVEKLYSLAFAAGADEALKTEAETSYDKHIEWSQWISKVRKILNPGPIQVVGATANPLAAVSQAVDPPVRPAAVMRQPDPIKPPILQTNTSLEDFDSWCEIWKDYEDVANFANMPLASQLARFRSFLSPEMRTELVHGVGVQNNDQTPPQQILGQIRDYLRERRNIALDRVAFEERVQRDGETFDGFLIALKKIAANADLCQNCYDPRLATRVMVGIQDQETKKKLLAMKPFPMLQQVVDVSRSEECARNNADALNGDAKRGRQFNKVGKKDDKTRKGYPGRSRSRPPRRQSADRHDPKDACWFCGNPRHKKRDDCPAFNSECNTCGKKGHFAKMCRSGSKDKDKKPGGTEKRQKSIRLQAAKGIKATKAPTIRVDLFSNANRYLGNVDATPDTGAEGTAMGVGMLKHLGIDPDNLTHRGDATLLAANEKQIDCIGTLQLTFRFNGQCVKDTVYVCRELKGLLLPWYVMKSMGILPQDYPKPLKVSAVRQQDSQFNPKDVPIDPTPEQIESFKKKLLETYADVFDSESELKPMDIPPMKIKLKGDVEPFAVRAARPIAFSWREDVKKEIDWMVERKIIAPVGEEPSEWCHPLVCVPKANGGVRPCVDLTKLNPHVVRPLHPLKSPKEAVGNVPSGSKYLSSLDATKGYWQMSLDKASQDLTTFITPWGRFKFLRAPMGLVSTGDEFCRVGDKALEGIDNVQKVVDDMLVYDEGFPAHVARIIQILEACRRHKITLNPAKFKFAQDKVDFAGYNVSRQGVTTDENKLRAIQEFPTPTNLTELRSFIGLVNQLMDFTKDISTVLGPLRPLLSSKNQFVWTPDHDKAFKHTKSTLVKVHILTSFDPELETVLLSDASRTKGLGFALMQKHPAEWKVVQCGSRFLLPAEARYAMVELELLGIQYAASKCKLYLEGLPHFRIITDHKPLIPILNDQTLADIDNARILRLKEKLANFVFTAEWRKGADHVVPDALSRAPVDQPDEEDIEAEKAITGHLKRVMSIKMAEVLSNDETSQSDLWIQELQDAAGKDKDYQCLVSTIENDNWNQQDSAYVKSFRKIRDELSLTEGLVIFEGRFVVPITAKSMILDKLHASHQGVVKTKRRARQAVFWPGINSDIENKVGSCSKCQENLASLPKEPMLHDDPPVWVFQNVATDLFQWGSHYYLVYVDQLSGWPVVADFHQRAPSAKDVIKILRTCFVDLGVPVKLRSDNGPQFAAREFKEFLERWGVTHSTSTPTYAQSNGLAEAAVKAMKALVKKATLNGNLDDDAYCQGLLEYRNTPRENGSSPAEIVFGHQIRSLLPVHHSQFSAKWTEIRQKVDEKQAEISDEKDQYYNATAKKHPPFKIGDEVRVQDHQTKKWTHSGHVVAIGKYRDYLVKAPSGAVMWRNRRFIRPNRPVVSDDGQNMLPPEGGGGAGKDDTLVPVTPKGILKKRDFWAPKKKVRFSDDTEVRRRSPRRFKQPERFSP